MDFLREKEGRTSTERRPSFQKDSDADDDETNIESNVDFLKTMEDNDGSRKNRRSSSASKQAKRSSLPSMSLSGTKTLLAGKFGDAFKRFENNASAPPGPRTPSPLHDLERRDLTPIAGSEATDGRSDDGNILEDMDNLPPEQRREIERRRLSIEEKRVADAAAEYRRRLTEHPAPKSIGGITRAASIQRKVKTLLDENQQPSPIKKSAEGYGRYTDAPSSQAPPLQPVNPYANVVTRKPISSVPARPTGNEIDYSKPRTSQPLALPVTVSKTGPRAPPKPTHLNHINTGSHHPSSSINNSPPKPSFLANRPVQPRPDMTQQEKEVYMQDFSKRFPSLNSIELVEREIAKREMEPTDVGARRIEGGWVKEV